jgi:protein-disulfide isomerase
LKSKAKFAVLGLVALAAAASPFVLKLEARHDAIAAGVEPASGGSNGFSSAQKTELESIIKDYILKNPQVLIDSVNNMRNAEQAANDEKAAQGLKENADFFFKGDLPKAGSETADVTVIEFFDYNCGYCKQGFESVRQGLESDKKLRFVFVDFPILSESSHLASRYALAAQKQGKYFELHRALMQFKGPKTDETILKLAGDAGLDTAKLKADSNDPAIAAQLKKNTDMAEKLAISGTPAFIIGDEIIRGYIPFEAMKTMIADERKKKG